MLIYCYGRILWVLTRRIDSNLDTRGSHADTFQVAKTNTLKTFLMVGICFIICWSSNQAYYLMDNIGYHVNWNGTYYKFTVLMVFLNCTVNPFIYLIKYKDYQLALKLCFGCGRRTDGEEIDMKSSTSTKSTIIGNHIWNMHLASSLLITNCCVAETKAITKAPYTYIVYWTLKCGSQCKCKGLL